MALTPRRYPDISTRQTNISRPSTVCPLRPTTAPLSHNPLQAELTGMMEDEGAIFLVQVLVKPQPRPGTSQNCSELCLALPEWIASQVDAVKLDQVECPHENAVVSLPSPDQLKTGDPVMTAGDGLAVDNAGLGAQPRKSVDNQGEPWRQIVARTTIDGEAVWCGPDGMQNLERDRYPVS